MAQPVSPSQRLASMSGPLGGAPQRPPAQPAAPAAAKPAAFPDMLAGQIGPHGPLSLSGIAGLPNAASATTPFTDSLAAMLGGQTGAAGALSGMASPQLTRAAASVPALAAPGAAATGITPPAQRAVQWALSMVGRQDWNNLCERFVEEAYGANGVYPSAKDAARALVTHRGRSSLASAPPGALLYFAADDTNDFHGHAAIYLGDGKMVSARPNGVQVESVHTPYNLDRYLGWGEGTRIPARGRGAAPVLPMGAPRVASRVPTTGALPGIGESLVPAGTGLPAVGAAAAAPASAATASQRILPRMPAPPPASVAQAAARTRLTAPVATAAIDRLAAPPTTPVAPSPLGVPAPVPMASQAAALPASQATPRRAPPAAPSAPAAPLTPFAPATTPTRNRP